MPQNNNQNNKKKKGDLKSIVESYFGSDISHEIRQLIDLAVRKQFDAQEFVQRLANTHYFHQKFPGLIEKNGTIANELSGGQGVTVSAASLGQAISHYKTGLSQFQDIASQYGTSINKDQFAASLKAQTSATEYKARLQAIDTIDSNPSLMQAFEQQAKAFGLKATPQAAYRAAAGAGDRKFMNIYEAASYQQQLGLGQQEAKQLATGGGAATASATFDNVDQIVAQARQNLQALAPELANQGINAAKLVKVFSNPGAYSTEIGKIGDLLKQRQGLFGNPVSGTYGQQGPGGGLQQFQQQRDQAY